MMVVPGFRDATVSSAVRRSSFFRADEMRQEADQPIFPEAPAAPFSRRIRIESSRFFAPHLVAGVSATFIKQIQ